jgi:hypothetical protein
MPRRFGAGNIFGIDVGSEKGTTRWDLAWTSEVRPGIEPHTDHCLERRSGNFGGDRRDFRQTRPPTLQAS